MCQQPRYSELHRHLNTAHTMVPPVIHLVNTPAGVADLLGELQNAPVVALDCEGSDLGRHGRLCTLTVAIHGRNEAWVMDVVELGRLAFSTPGQGNGSTLKAWLESTSAVKLLYDARADCDALYHQYGVQLGRCLDLQVAEVAYRRHVRQLNVKYVLGLGTALKEYARESGAAESLVKTAVHVEFAKDPEYWTQRPLTDTQLAYCAEDVVPLFELYDKFWGGLNDRDMHRVVARVWSASEARVLEALRPETPPQGRQRAVAPSV